MAVAVALSGASPARAAGAPVHEATSDQVKGAQKEFEAADLLYDAKRYAEALTAFRASHDIVASPNARLMIARSLRELGRVGEAYGELEATLADAEQATQKSEKYRQTANAAREDLAALKAAVAFITVRVQGAPAGATVSVGGRTFDASALDKPLVVSPGSVVVTASAPGRPEQTKELSLSAGATEDVELDLGGSETRAGSLDSGDPPEPAPRPVHEKKGVELGPDTSMRTWAYVSGGVGVAGLVAFGVFGALNNSQFSGLEEDCPGGRCPPGRDEDIDAGRRYQTFANVGAVVGLVGVATGFTLFVLSGSREKKTPAAVERLDVAPGAVTLRGQF